jgi:sodium/hydrogen exchanger-like protein 6/7
MSQLSENFVFIYLGVTLFTFGKHDLNFIMIIIALVSIMVARYLSVIPLAEIINYIASLSESSSLDPKIPRNHQLSKYPVI